MCRNMSLVIGTKELSLNYFSDFWGPGQANEHTTSTSFHWSSFLTCNPHITIWLFPHTLLFQHFSISRVFPMCTLSSANKTFLFTFNTFAMQFCFVYRFSTVNFTRDILVPLKSHCRHGSHGPSHHVYWEVGADVEALSLTSEKLFMYGNDETYKCACNSCLSEQRSSGCILIKIYRCVGTNWRAQRLCYRLQVDGRTFPKEITPQRNYFWEQWILNLDKLSLNNSFHWVDEFYTMARFYNNAKYVKYNILPRMEM